LLNSGSIARVSSLDSKNFKLTNTRFHERLLKSDLTFTHLLYTSRYNTETFKTIHCANVLTNDTTLKRIYD